MASLVFVCETGHTSVLSGSPVPAGYQLPSCQAGYGSWVDVGELVTDAVDLELIGVTPEAITAAFLFGFGAVMSFWWLGYLGGMAKRAVNQA